MTVRDEDDDASGMSRAEIAIAFLAGQSLMRRAEREEALTLIRTRGSAGYCAGRGERVQVARSAIEWDEITRGVGR